VTEEVGSQKVDAVSSVTLLFPAAVLVAVVTLVIIACCQQSKPTPGSAKIL